MLLQSQHADLVTPTGTMRTYVHRPAGEGRYPAVLFYSEIFQQTGPIERAARLLAGHGYAVLVPEIFHELNPVGTVLAYDNPGRDKGNADKAAKPVEDYDRDNRAMIDWLAGQPWYSGQLGAMGFCIGGHLAFRAALQPEVRGTACFYATDLHTQVIPNQPGQHSMDRAGEIGGELLMIWGKQDPHIPATGRAEVYARLAALGLDFTWHEFNGQHAFMRDEGERYDAQLQRLGYELVFDLFGRTLR
ncbi:dienelactone hydrolase family protein [Chitiniphilus purpureus]|uniref:Dienelactone hydrolase family protein n=1 Tax=Chitiniphilus purpureus TaxID=2981137 RepID=A0ABY6DMU2_9NEIS|nr:dienelactone hydrolase family protein [Chitiniphilus sp. CD1]UXY15528.1 dienelactone hydrolase family protein [Chitiniphilus sp. CD1]